MQHGASITQAMMLAHLCPLPSCCSKLEALVCITGLVGSAWPRRRGVAAGNQSAAERSPESDRSPVRTCAITRFEHQTTAAARTAARQVEHQSRPNQGCAEAMGMLQERENRVGVEKITAGIVPGKQVRALALWCSVATGFRENRLRAAEPYQGWQQEIRSLLRCDRCYPAGTLGAIMSSLLILQQWGTAGSNQSSLRLSTLPAQHALPNAHPIRTNMHHLTANAGRRRMCLLGTDCVRFC